MQEYWVRFSKNLLLYLHQKYLLIKESKMKKVFFILMVLTLVFVGCSSKNDSDYYKVAKQEIDSENYESALNNFQAIVNEFPNSKFYKDALLQTGELNHGLVNSKISKTESYKKAIVAYSLFQKKYPKDKKAPQTLFMIGFIQANQLGQLEAAKKTYTKFLELYPESEMAESAKSEIETLGLSPDEILKIKNTK